MSIFDIYIQKDSLEIHTGFKYEDLILIRKANESHVNYKCIFCELTLEILK